MTRIKPKNTKAAKSAKGAKATKAAGPGAKANARTVVLSESGPQGTVVSYKAGPDDEWQVVVRRQGRNVPIEIFIDGEPTSADLLDGLKQGQLPASGITARLPKAVRAVPLSHVLIAAKYVNLPMTITALEEQGINVECKLKDLSAKQRRDTSRVLRQCESLARRYGTHEAPAGRLTRDRKRVLAEWADQLGELLEPEAAAEKVGGADVLESLEAAGLVFSLAAGQHVVYPEFQFLAPDYALGPLHTFITEAGSVSPWTSASWLVTRNLDLEDLTPLDWLEADEDRGWLWTVAERDAERMAQ